MSSLTLDPKTTALVLIDLQEGIVAMPVAPRSGPDVVANAVRLLDRFRASGATVVLVKVDFLTDRDRLNPPVDSPAPGRPSRGGYVPAIGPKEGDVLITKRQWGAFYGTELDLVLRRRGVRTIVLGGIATNIGVESTARAAYEHGYEQVFVEDAMSSISADAHAFAVKFIFPRIGRVRSTDQVLQALTPGA